jgi:hypothetical protein
MGPAPGNPDLMPVASELADQIAGPSVGNTDDQVVQALLAARTVAILMRRLGVEARRSSPTAAST